MKEKPQYSYKDGKSEAVMFVFKRNNQLLIEHRFDKEPPEPYIPNGSIEMKDRIAAGDKGDYREVALRREINEEFNGKITPIKYEYLSEFTVEQRKSIFYIYKVSEWLGEFEKYSVEEDKVAAELEWVDEARARTLFIYPLLFHALDVVFPKK